MSLLTAPILLVVVNCAFPASREGMTVRDYTAAKPIDDKIFVQESTGGSITLPFWMSKIGNTNFTDALKDSIITSRLFNTLDDSFGQGWKLKIEIINVDQPLIGLDFQVKTKVKYSLLKGDNLVKELIIDAEGTGKMDDAFLGVVRMRLANEAAAKANIRKFLEEVSTSVKK